jgi:hypothetical protein
VSSGYVSVCKRKVLLNTLMSRVVLCRVLGSVCRPLWNISIPPRSTIGRTRVEILVSTLERQVSRGDTDGEVVDH